MIGPSHFRVEVISDASGTLVTVLHAQTRQRRSARPAKGESCFGVEGRLQTEIVRTFFRAEDFRIEVGRCEVNGKFGGFYRVEHLPSGRSKEMDTITSPNVKQPHQLLLESLLEELWRDGALPIVPDQTSAAP